MPTQRILLLLALACCASCTTNYYLVRHAERLDNSADTPLSPAGLTRANVLRDSLLDNSIDLIFSSTYLRTRQTAQPLADALGYPLNLYNPDTTNQFINRLKKIQGKDVLVTGHSDNVPTMVQGLTGETVVIPSDDFDNLFIVKITRGWGRKKVRLTRATYGVPSP